MIGLVDLIRDWVWAAQGWFQKRFFDPHDRDAEDG